MKLNFFRQTFEKSSNIKFYQNLSSERRVVPCGQTDGHDEAQSLSAILRTRLKGNINLLYLNLRTVPRSKQNPFRL
jgi:hypothetical protein